MSNWVASEFNKLRAWIDSIFAPLHSRVSSLESRVKSLEDELAKKL